MPMAIFTLVLGVLTMAPTWFDLGIEPEEQRKLVWAMSGVGVCTILLMLPLPVWMKWTSTKARVRWK